MQQACVGYLEAFPYYADRNRCLHCGRCAQSCPKQVIIGSRKF
ncbi:4Fe-4S binding protein, partial [uncultured Acetatifactor sp.]